MFRHHKEASELKQQGAIEAARDPQSTVTSDDAERKIVEESRKAGGSAMLFDPNASPEEKAAQARAQVPEGLHREKKPNAMAIISDTDGGPTAGYDLGPPSKPRALPVPATGPNGTPHANGKLNDDMRPARDRTGSTPRVGQGAPADTEGHGSHDETWLETHLEDKWFGEWWHNAGIIVFACLSTYVTTLLGAGLTSVFIILAFCSTYYRTSIRRVRRNYRDDINREMAKARLETDYESLEWVNSVVVKFWPIYTPVLRAIITNSVDQVLSTTTPAFLDSLRLKLVELGTKPPRLEHVKTYPKAEDDIILTDWKFSFTPNDTADMTARQVKSKINPKIVLEVRVGKGIVSKGLDVIVEDFACSGTMRVKVKLQLSYPFVEKAEICFLGRPTIDYTCKPLGGDTFGFDLHFIPGLQSFISEQIHGNLGPMMYAPNVFPIEIAKMLAGSVDQAIGVVQVTIHSGQGLKNPDKFSGGTDPYATVSIDDRVEYGRTKIVPGNSNPSWHETFHIIVSSLKDSLTLAVFDYNEYRKDKKLGVANFPLDRLEEDNIHENVQLEVMGGGGGARACGILIADVRFFPVLEAAKLPDGNEGDVPESNTGIAKFTVEQAKDLDSSKSLFGQLNPYAVLLLNNKEIQTSQKLKRTNNPIWPDASKQFLITDRKSAKLGVVIKDDSGLPGDPILGTEHMKLDDLIECSARGQEWFPLAGSKTGRAKLTLQWKPVALRGATGSGGYITPIGVMRFHFQNARDLGNLETVGKSDPYVRVLLSGIPKARTVTSFSNLNPDFDEVVYVPMHSHREKLTLEVMDQETGADRSMGLVELNASDFIRQDESGEYLTHDEKKLRSDRLKPQGTLNYTCAFYPCYNVVDPEEEEAERQREKEAVATPRASMESTKSSINGGRTERSGTITSLNKGRSSLEMRQKLAEGEKEHEVPMIKEPPKIKIGVDDLQHYESGLIIFRIIDAELAHSDCYIEIKMDDYLFPAYRSAKTRTRFSKINDTGDAIVREIDFSKITLQLRERPNDKNGTEDHTIAKLTGNTLDVLKRGLYQSVPLTLKGQDGRDSHLTVYLKYLPIKMNLDPSESINNQGKLMVDVLDAADLPAADSNGLSDPYCKFIINGKQTYKTNRQEKTLHPAWNERFECNIPSRTEANFKVEIWDWDRGDKDDFLGAAAINLEVLEPFQAQEVTYDLDGKSGAVRLKMLFRPDYVTRASRGTSTFSETFATPGKIIGAPVKGIGKAGTFVGGGVARGASFMTRGFRSKKSGGGGADTGSTEPASASQTHIIDSHPPSSAPRIIAEGDSPSTPSHNRQRSDGPEATTPGNADVGTATISIVSASGYEGGNVRVSLKQTAQRGAKEVHKTKTMKATRQQELSFGDNESCKVTCAADAQFTVSVKDVRTFGTDVDMGDGTFSLAEAELAAGGAKIVRVGAGTVTVTCSFVASEAGSMLAAANSPAGGKLRKSILTRSPKAPASAEDA